MNRLAFRSLLVFVFFLPLEKTFQFAGIGTISRPIGFVVLLLALLSLVTRGGMKFRRPSYFLGVMALFVLWNAASMFWTIGPDETLERIETYAQLLAMVWMIWQLTQRDEDRLALLQAYIIGAIVSTSTALSNFLAGNTQDEWLRFAGSGFDPNDFATTLALGIPMAWYLVSSRRHRWFYWLNMAYVPWVLFINVLTSSRGGLILSIFALGIIPLTYGALSLRRKLGFMVLLLLVSAFSLLEVGPDLYEAVAPNLNRLSTLSNEVSRGDLNYRTVIWQVGFDLVRERPWLGVGSGTFPQAAGPRLDRERRPHNAYLAVVAETGLIGLVIFLILFAVAAWPMLQLGPPHRAFNVVLLLTLMLGMMPLNWETRKPTYFVLALFTAQRAYVMQSSDGTAAAAKRLQPGSET